MRLTFVGRRDGAQDGGRHGRAQRGGELVLLVQVELPQTQLDVQLDVQIQPVILSRRYRSHRLPFEVIQDVSHCHGNLAETGQDREGMSFRF